MVDHEPVAALGNKRYVRLVLKAGVNTLNPAQQGAPIASVALDNLAGESVYLTWRCCKTDELTRIEADEATALLRKMKPAKPVKSIRSNPQEMIVLSNLTRMGIDLMVPADPSASMSSRQHATGTFCEKKRHLNCVSASGVRTAISGRCARVRRSL